jgi:23S rRNA pseudouridine1911/1915/1917 synthase
VERSAGAGRGEARRLELVVGTGDAGCRLDVFLGRAPGAGSRSRVAGWIQRGAVTVDGVSRPKSYPLAAGQVVTVSLPEEESPVLVAEDRPVSVVYEDEWLLVVDKPAGMTVHPSRGHSSGTLVHALLGHGAAGGDPFRPGVVHRLDKDTTGLLVVAKSEDSHRALAAMMRKHAVDRHYLALVHGNFSADTGTIEAPVGRNPGRRTTMAVGGIAAREARTHFRVLERFADFTLLEVRLETGRTHQIRVHFLAIGHPVVGDPTYARKDALAVGRQFLHSHRLSFAHPITGRRIELESPLPADLAQALEQLRVDRSAQGG